MIEGMQRYEIAQQAKKYSQCFFQLYKTETKDNIRILKSQAMCLCSHKDTTLVLKRVLHIIIFFYYFFFFQGVYWQGK